MKKTVKLVLITMLLSVLLCACGNEKETEQKPGDNRESNKTYVTQEEIKEAESKGIELKVLSAGDGEIEFEITNNSELEAMYGDDFFILVEDDSGWFYHETLSDLVFNSIGYGVAKGESSKGKLNYPEYYGKLEAGKYMLAKPVSLRENSGDTPAEPEFFKAFAEFEIK